MKSRISKPPRRPIVGESVVSFNLDVRSYGLKPIMGAAYLLTDRAYATLEGDRHRKIIVTLRSKTPLTPTETQGLAKMFRQELETQKLRWAIAENNLPVREYIAEEAVRLANGALPAPQDCQSPSDPLTDEQRKEIDRLIAEVEEEIRMMNSQKEAKDPKNIAIPWEQKHSEKPA